jgi:predicted ester cyclase
MGWAGRASISSRNGVTRVPGAQIDTGAMLEAVYHAYLTVLNERRFDDLVQFVHDELTYNGEPMTRHQYADLIAADVAAVPDLAFTAEIVVADEEQVACRLWFDCTPQHQFLGFAPDGNRISFAEHVFYRFRDDRITSVWSLIDRPAVREQLHRTGQIHRPPPAGER